MRQFLGRAKENAFHIFSPTFFAPFFSGERFIRSDKLSSRGNCTKASSSVSILCMVLHVMYEDLHPKHVLLND